MGRARTDPTKGPWKYDGQVFIFGPGGEMIAEVRGVGGDLPMDANGHVLGASRDLLEVCAAIAKARGKGG
ncbi:hypothetical protein LCGC14_0860820 [marine sediment metagenome]|uniref:Uncharacterized protein n=1 Tax=marine sediment metagenome TaxID=412755 RepID=A0A0F9PCJ4_9ZZZZ